jgi:hydrogenase maturation protein HypF
MMKEQEGFAVRVRGQVQGVGFRPTVLRLATRLDLVGDVLNDGEGVEVRLFCARPGVESFITALHDQCPPLARIDGVEVKGIRGLPPASFRIVESRGGLADTGITPDAATCPACRGELLDAGDRRYRYPFTNCTHCGPRLTIVEGIPYDRQRTSMRGFPMCPACAEEYADPLDRRFHAQPNACGVCGPQVKLLDRHGKEVPGMAGRDLLAHAGELLAQGAILAVKGIGGFHLACDASNEGAVQELRRRKRRHGKPFALMARDRAMIAAHAQLDETGWRALSSPAAPVVILPRIGDQEGGGIRIAKSVAPHQDTLGFMLAYSPLHILLLEGLDGPLVMTSGNLSSEPQCIAEDQALTRLAGIPDYFLIHDRPIVNRVDDSVVRVMGGEPRLYRRARGYAPAATPLPKGLPRERSLLAMGGELKNAFCLVKRGQAVLSQHIGDLEDAATYDDYRAMLDLYARLYRHSPEAILIDAHPGYRASRYGRQLAEQLGVEVMAI